jgi:hypothetical protein
MVIYFFRKSHGINIWSLSLTDYENKDQQDMAACNKRIPYKTKHHRQQGEQNGTKQKRILIKKRSLNRIKYSGVINN